MKFATQKQPFFGDSYVIESIYLASISCIQRLIFTFLFVFSSTFFLNFNAFSFEKNSLQVPVKKSIPTPTKSISSKTVKSKAKGAKSKKNVVVKKDTLIDIDPATASSPLYNN